MHVISIMHVRKENTISLVIWVKERDESARVWFHSLGFVALTIKQAMAVSAKMLYNTELSF